MQLTTSIVLQIAPKIFFKSLLMILLLILPAACSENEPTQKRSGSQQPRARADTSKTGRAVGTKDDGLHGIRMSTKRPARRAQLGIPEYDRSVRTGRCQCRVAMVAGREGQCGHSTCVACQQERFVRRVEPPNSNSDSAGP